MRRRTSHENSASKHKILRTHFEAKMQRMTWNPEASAKEDEEFACIDCITLLALCTPALNGVNFP